MKVTIELDGTDLKKESNARALVMLITGKDLEASIQPAVVTADNPQDNTPADAERIQEQEPEPPAKISRPAKGRFPFTHPLPPKLSEGQVFESLYFTRTVWRSRICGTVLPVPCGGRSLPQWLSPGVFAGPRRCLR